jgi:hypothetical protein
MRLGFLIARKRFLGCAVAVLCLGCAGVAGAQHDKNHGSGLIWNPPNTDSKIADLSDTPPCSLPDVMQQASARAIDFVDNLQKFDAVEHSELMQTRTETSEVSWGNGRFDFTAEFTTVNGHLQLHESRQELDHNNPNGTSIEDVGLPALALIFHPDFSGDFGFQCLGAAPWKDQPAWVVSFRQAKGKPSRLMAFRTATSNIPAKLKGRAWIAQDSGQILHLETNLIDPIGLIDLMSNAISIDYAPVQFQTANVKLWLPVMATAYSQYNKFTLVKSHSYSDFKLFSVGTQQVIEKPKIPGVQKDPDTPAPATPPAAVPAPATPPATDPAPGEKPAEPAPPKQ